MHAYYCCSLILIAMQSVHDTESLSTLANLHTNIYFKP